MTRNLTFGVVVVALLVAASGVAGAAGAAAVTDTTDTIDATATADDSASFAQETTTTDNDSAESNATIGFDEQSSNGSVVVVNETTLAEGGFIAIYAENGTVIGNSSYLEPGEHENVTVELDVTLEETQVLVAVAHADTNGDERFDFNVSEAQAAATTAETTTGETTTEMDVTDSPYLVDGLPVTDVAYIAIGDDDTRRNGTETESE